ncbi:hypothetical protein RA27_22750 [Ruegeria sp. ANG-R]|nr:hypothetical protein RA27_22750 [Ruegeria sp. ANG-R]
MSVLCATTAFAEDDQLDLARQIEDASRTTDHPSSESSKGAGWSIYPPLFADMHEMEVSNCNITARTISIGVVEDPNSEITFDLNRTQIPDPTVPIGSEYVFTPVKDNKSAMTSITFRFFHPYKPVMRSKKFIGEGKIEQPVTFLQFLMQPVSDEEQPRRLLALLNQYQSAYCTYTG